MGERERMKFLADPGTSQPPLPSFPPSLTVGCSQLGSLRGKRGRVQARVFHHIATTGGENRTGRRAVLGGLDGSVAAL